MRAHIISLALLCSAGAGGCSSDLWGTNPSVDSEVIVSRVKQCHDPKNDSKDNATLANDYMQVGFSNVIAACEAFFVNATRFQQNALAASSTADAGLIGATAIITATSSAAAAVKAITVATAGVTLVKALANDYATIYTFGTHLYKVRDLVRKDMSAYMAQASATNTCIAYANVQVLATKCTIANMHALLDGQVAINSTVTNLDYIKIGGKIRILPRNSNALPSISSTVVPIPVQ